MKSNLLFTVAFVLLSMSFTFGSTSLPTTTKTPIATTCIEEAPNGGPRNVIQEKTAIEIQQEYSSPLAITMTDSGGNVVFSTTSEELSIYISTVGFSVGEYRIETLAEGEEVAQVDYISIN